MSAPSGRRERKVVTVLFADLVGFTARSEQLDPEDVEAVLRPYHERLRTELERFGGTVEKFIGDAVMAVFGAPVAHEDDSERAVRAALAIRDAAVAGGELEVRIGVNTGQALVNLDARTDAGEGLVAGDVVNTAARLQSAAPVNGVLVGEVTYRTTRDAVEYREVEQVVAKGKAAPVPVWEAVSPRARTGVDVVQRGGTRLVGREAELAALRRALERGRAEARPHAVTLVGAPGIGKSRLVWELFASLDQAGGLVLWRQGRSLPYGEGGSFWALGEVVKAHAGIHESDSTAEAEDKLARMLADTVSETGEREWIARHLRPLVGLEETEPLGSDRRAEAFAAWRRFLETVAERAPLVLVFEDLHWAEDGVLDFVADLPDRVEAPLLVLATARPQLLERRPSWSAGSPTAQTIVLEPLSDDESASIIGQLLDDDALPGELERALLSRVAGNPLYAEHYVRMLVEQGFLERDGDGWQLTQAELPHPEAIQGIIAARLDALPPEEKALLQDASVLGKVFWAGGAASVGERDRWEVEDRLHALARKELVRRDRRTTVEGEPEYAFRHVLVREAAYESLTRAARAERHRRAAEWLERVGEERGGDLAELVAHHYTSALDLARAARLPDAAELEQPARRALVAAGDRASAVGAYAAAAGLYRRALELVPDADPGRPQLLFRLGRARFHAEDEDAELLAARDALEAAGDRPAAAVADFMVGELLWRRGAGEAARLHLDRAAEVLRHVEPSRQSAYVLAHYAIFRHFAGESEDGLALARGALESGDRLGADDVRTMALDAIGLILAATGQPEEGLRSLGESVRVGEAGHVPEVAVAYGNLSSMQYALGDLRASRETFRRGLRAGERLGHWAARWLAEEESSHAYEAGEWDLALAGAARALEDPAGVPYQRPAHHCARALVRLAREDVRGALADMAEAEKGARAAGDPQILYPILAAAAEIAAESGEVGRAHSLVDELVERDRSQAIAVAAPDALAPLAFAAVALGREDDVAALHLDAARSRWVDAAHALLAHEWPAAVALLGEIGSVPFEALARLHAGAALAEEGRASEAGRELEHALAFWRSVGATRYLSRAESLLAAVT